MMGYQTPDIDRIAKENIAFTDYYGQQSYTAGRTAFINLSVAARSGMTKVGPNGGFGRIEGPLSDPVYVCKGSKADNQRPTYARAA
jgi:arylsulfatase A-like enzyme